MGAIWFRGAEFVASLSEIVGFKTGLALSAERLKGILDDIDPRLWPPSDDLREVQPWRRPRALVRGRLSEVAAGRLRRRAPVDGIEETVTAEASSLSHDAVSDQYSHVWKTDKGWANTRRQLVLKLVDDTNHRGSLARP